MNTPWRGISRPAPAACVVGIVAGVTYTLSPTTVWCGLLTALIFAWAGRGITGRERVWLFRLLFFALALRVAALAAFFLLTYPYDGPFPLLIPDESTIQHRAMWFRNMALGIPLAPADYIPAYGRYAESGHLYLLAFLQLQLGAAPYGIRLVNLVLYLTGVLVLYRTVRPTFGAPVALGGLALVLFLPSLFIWSISGLKEASYLCLTAVIVCAAVSAFRRPTIAGRVLAIVVCIVAVFVAETIRTGALIMVGGGVLVGLLMVTWIRRPILGLVSVFTVVIIGAYAVTQPRLQNDALNLLRRGAIIHHGHVDTPGWHYKLLDPRLYGTIDPTGSILTPGQLGRYAVRSAFGFLLVPLPWTAASPSTVAYLTEHVAWYILLVLATVGCVAGLRLDPRLTFVLLGIILLSGATIALTSGNVGTLVRHRAMVLMPLAWLGSLGASALVTQAAGSCRARNSVSTAEVTTS